MGVSNPDRAASLAHTDCARIAFDRRVLNHRRACINESCTLYGARHFVIESRCDGDERRSHEI
jgi:hypothetical protein